MTLYTVNKQTPTGVLQWRERYINGETVGDLEEDGTFYPDKVSAERALADCADIYGPEGLIIKEGILPL